MHPRTPPLAAAGTCPKECDGTSQDASKFALIRFADAAAHPSDYDMAWVGTLQEEDIIHGVRHYWRRVRSEDGHILPHGEQPLCPPSAHLLGCRPA